MKKKNEIALGHVGTADHTFIERLKRFVYKNNDSKWVLAHPNHYFGSNDQKI